MFVVIEGPNGVGKTTLINNLNSMGYKTLSSPNGTPLAKMIRPACRGTGEWQDLHPTIKFLLFSAARFDEYVRLIDNEKDLIIADRWWTSTYVYQCILEGIDAKFMESTIHPNENIDFVFNLFADEDVVIERMTNERKNNPSHGICSWTKDKDLMKKIAKIYSSDLPCYLFNRGIPCVNVDTTDLSEKDVLECFIEEVEKQKYLKEVEENCI